MRSPALMVAIALLAAGCVSPAADPGAEASADAADAQRTWTNRTLWLTGEPGLTDRPADGEPEEVPAGNFYTAWAQGEEQPTWTGEPIEDPLVVTNATLTFFYTAESATATTGPQDQGFPEFVVYFGTEGSPAAWASVEGPDVVPKGEVVEVTAELNLPKGGMYLPSGVMNEPVVKLAPVQGQGSAEGSRIVFLVNGTDQPSRVTFDAYEVERGSQSFKTIVDTQGTLAGSAYAAGAQEDTTADSYEIEIGPDHRGLTARLARETGAGIADIDLQLLGPEGDVVAQSVTPEDDEGLTLRENNVEAIGEGTWTLRVVNYGNAAVEYHLRADAVLKG